MKKIHDGVLSALFSFTILSLSGGHSGSTITLAGLADTVQEMKALVEGISAFMDHFSAFTGFVGAGTIFLLITVLFLSAGFTAVGIPKGKTSFLVSLFTADLLWVLWKLSFKPVNYDFVGGMVRSNLILLLPMIAVIFIGRYFPRILPAAANGIKRVFNGKASSRKELTMNLEQFQDLSSRVASSITQDLLKTGKDTIYLSPESKRAIGELESLIARVRGLEKKNKR